MGSIKNMPNREGIIWFDKGTYQGGTTREYDAVHIYDKDKQVISVFKKFTGEFVTTCRLDADEQIELLETGNFGSGKDWFSGRVRNVPKYPNNPDINKDDL